MVLVILLTALITGMTAYRPESQENAAAQIGSEQINRLASPNSIRSEADAKSYVDAVSNKWGGDGPSFEALRERVAHAEFLAIRNPSGRISEERVAGGFNLLMKELGSPQEMQITKERIHNFRRNFLASAGSLSLSGNIFALRPDGSLDDTCRPVEALYLIFLLQYGPNIEASGSAAASTRPDKTGISVQATFATPGLRESEYSAAIDRYFRLHGESEFVETLGRVLDVLLGVRV